jgi:4-hydroxy-tetrahydrodipicolinate reductase
MGAGRSAETKVALTGYRGRVGRALVPILEATPDIEYVGGIERGEDLRAFLAARRPQALVDFTHPSTALDNALTAIATDVIPVVGTSGLSDEAVDRIEAACGQRGLGGIVAPNFAIGAVVMMWLAEKAAPFFEAVEVIESHHAGKADAPSSTALATARRLAAVKVFSHSQPTKVTLDHVRGGDSEGVAVHSLRLPGVVADQQIIFGLAGQTLSITHRTTSREAFAPGVLLAIRSLVAKPRFYRSLDQVLGLH